LQRFTAGFNPNHPRYALFRISSMLFSPILWRSLYVMPNLLAAFGMFVVGVMAWRYRTQRAGMYLLIFAITAAIWAFFEGMSYIVSSAEEIYFLWQPEFIGVCVAPLALVLFAIEYVGYGRLITRRRLLALSVLPAITLLASWSNGWHGWIMSGIEMDFSTPIPTLANTSGPLLWIYYAYCNLLVLATIAFLLQRLPEFPPLQRRQVHLVLIAFSLPLLAAALYMTHLTPLRNMSLIPLAFNFAGLVLICGFLRERMFELAPVTAHEIYSSLEDPVFVLDDTNRILDFNGAALRLLQLPDAKLIGQPLPSLLPGTACLLSDYHAEHPGEVILHNDLYYDVRVAPLQSSGKRLSARLLVWRDITERKHLEADLYRLATTDPLTGLYNRRYFLERGQEEMRRARRYGHPLSLVMLDVDYFKRVNDSYGHEIGDHMLIKLAHILTNQCRTSDYIGRIGGEEFALLLTETSSATAYEVSSRLLESIRNARILLDDGKYVGFTVSAGVATLMTIDKGFDTLLRRADDALYHAKDEGRDCLMLSKMENV